MKYIIELPEEVYKRTIFYKEFYDLNDCVTTIKSLENAVPLPNEHGDLIDRSKLLVELECGIRAGNYEEGYEKYPHINDMDDCFDTVKYADTIIEADKGE